MLTEQEFRSVLGHLPTGVTIVTAHGEEPAGMACNSVTSVSLNPPLVSFCPAKSSTTWPDIEATGGFCINVMGRNEAELCRRFSQRDVDRFAGVEFKHGPRGPRLSEAVAWIDCDIYDLVEAGDHLVALGHVVELQARPDPEPLIFFRGGFGHFNALR